MRLGGYDKVRIVLSMIQNHFHFCVHLKITSLLVISCTWFLLVNLINSIIVGLGLSTITHAAMKTHFCAFVYT
jgi:hypothetical protein